MAAQADLEKLQANLGGVKHMQRPPDAMFVVDLKTEVIAVREAQRLRIPIIGLVDTNCDPDGIDYVIPGNDDAIRACALITKAIGDVVSEGRQVFRAEEEKARQEAEAQARREQEEKARREQEEKERAEAEARERAEAEAALTRPARRAARRRRGAGRRRRAGSRRGRPGSGGRGRRGRRRRRALPRPRTSRRPPRRRPPTRPPLRAPRPRSPPEVAPARPQGEGAAAAPEPAAAAPRRPRRRRGGQAAAEEAKPAAEARPSPPSEARTRASSTARRRRQRGRRHGPGRGGDGRQRSRGRRRGRRRRPRPAGSRAEEPEAAGAVGDAVHDEDKKKTNDQEEEGRGLEVSITAAQVKELRDRTGAGMMDCKKALQETNGDVDAAAELLRVRLGDKALKMGGREATEGTVQAYIHANSKVGVLIEVDCNTDFVARNDDFTAFAREVAMHIAASPTTQYVTEDEIPQDAKDAELRVFEQQAADKPEQVRGKIAEGKLRKWMEETVLLNQVHVNADKYDGKTIEQLRAELSGTTGENVVIRRFSRFAVGA